MPAQTLLGRRRCVWLLILVRLVLSIELHLGGSSAAPLFLGAGSSKPDKAAFPNSWSHTPSRTCAVSCRLGRVPRRPAATHSAICSSNASLATSVEVKVITGPWRSLYPSSQRPARPVQLVAWYLATTHYSSRPLLVATLAADCLDG